MAIKDIFTRQTIIPTDKTRGTQGPSRDTSSVQQIQQQRYQQEQLQFYTRQAEPIKNTVKTNIQNQINQKEEFIRKEKENIEKYEKIKREESDKYWRRDYEKRIDEARDDIRAYEKALGILKSELDKYDKITDPLEIVGSGTAYGDAVVKYARDVENNQMREDRNSRERAEQLRKYKETEEFKQLEKEYKLPPDISSYELNKVIQQANTKGQYDIKTGKFYPTTNTSWIPPGSNASDIIYVTQRMTNWNQVEKKLNDGSVLIQLQNPANKEEIVNIGTKYPQQNQVVAASQVPSNTFEASYGYGFNPIPLKDQLATASTLGKKVEVLYNYADEKARGFLPGGMTPQQVRGTRGGYQKDAEDYTELVSKGFYEVMEMGEFDLKEFLWCGKSYKTETAVEALAEITRRDLEKNYEDNVLSRAKELTNQYNNQVNQIFNTSSGDANIDKKINAAYDEYEKQMKQLDENWQKGEGKQILDERTKRIEDFKNVSAWKSLSLPKIGTAVVAGALIGSIAAPAAAGAFGSTGIAVTTGIQTLGVGALTMGAGATAIRLLDEYESGTLNKDRLMSIVGPQIVLIGATAIGGAVGGSIGIAKFKKAQTEFMLNINKQIVGNEALQKQLFTPANMKRGYAEINYGGYKMRFNVNEKLLTKLQLQNIFLKEGGIKYGAGIKKTEYVGINYEKRILIEENLKNQLGLNRDNFILGEGGIQAIKASTVSARLKIVGAEKIWYSVNGRAGGKSIEIIFTLSKSGKIMNPYIAVKTPSVINPNIIIVNTGKIIQTTRLTKIPVKGGTELNVMNVNVKPVGTKLIVLKKTGGSILDNGNIVVEKAKYDLLIKELFGAKTGKIGEENLWGFITRNRIIQVNTKLSSKGIIEKGDVDIFSVSTSKARGAATEISTVSKVRGKTEQDIWGFGDIKVSKVKIPKPSKTTTPDQQFIDNILPKSNGKSGQDIWGFGDIKVSKVKIPKPSKTTTPDQQFIDNILPKSNGKSGQDIFRLKLDSKSETFNPDYILGTSIPSPKIKAGKLTPTKADNSWQFPSYVGGTASAQTGDTLYGLDYNKIGGFSFVEEAGKLTKSIDNQIQRDTFGFATLSNNLKLDTRTSQKQTSLQVNKQKIALKQMQRAFVKQIQKYLVGQGFELDKRTSQKQTSLQVNKQKIALKQIQIQRDFVKQQDIFGFNSFGTASKMQIPKPIPPKPKPFNWGFPSFSTQPKVSTPKQKDSFWNWGFVAKVRRKGEFKAVSKVVSEKEAFLIGSDIVKNTLGATFKVEKAPKKIKVKQKDSDWEWIDEDFYTKKEKGRTLFIEKREKRLGTKGERKEIQKAKKAKKAKTKSFLDWW